MVTPKFQFGLMDDAKLIREEVFVVEQGFTEEFDPDENEHWNLVLYYNDVPMATGRLAEIDPESYRLERIAVRKPFRGKKIGTYVVKFLIQKALSLGARKAYAHAQLDKQGFYEKLGFTPTTGEIDYEQGVAHIMMGKTIAKPRKWARRKR